MLYPMRIFQRWQRQKGTSTLLVHRLYVQRLSHLLELLRLTPEPRAKAVSPSPRIRVC
jgi:hypothetical protein